MPIARKRKPRARRRLGEQFADLTWREITRLLDRMPAHEMLATRLTWDDWALVRQLPPDGDWRVWLLMGGRGYGKTRAGAEWVDEVAGNGDAATRIALVGATQRDVRDIMIEGESGILNLSTANARPDWEPSIGRLTWQSGATAWVFSGASPAALRGPQHSHAWCDELAKWRYPRATWDNLLLGLRLGETPRAVVTTTPGKTKLLRDLLQAGDVAVTRGRTMENTILPDAFHDAMTAEYGGTRLGRQELDGELIEDADGALWTRDLIEACRVRPDAGDVPALVRVVVGVDPPAGSVSGDDGDACGIVVAGIDRAGVAFVIEDASVASGKPEIWAHAVADAAARHRADKVVAEANNGGAMVAEVLRAADAGLPVKLVHASRGKTARAEPVQLLYARGLVKHAGAFPALEDQLCGLIIGGGYDGPGRSPDRADACVWAMTELTGGKSKVEPRVRAV